MYCLTDYPLKDAETVEDILSYKWPKPEDIIDVTGLEDMAKQLYNETDLALTATFGGNVFERSHYLRSMDNFLVDLIAEPEMAGALMAKVLEIQMSVETLVLDAIGKYLTYMRFNGEDFGTQNGLLISRELFQSVVRSHLQKEWRTTKEKFIGKNPKGKISIHSCGSVFELMPVFIEMGADMLNPIQPNAKGMDTKIIKERYGANLCFHGGIDTQDVLNSGNQEDVRTEVRKRISDLAPGGGYICAPAHNIQHGMPVANIIAMYKAIQEFGQYPIKL
jgi:uroporphyrinogen decarboxylase